MVSRIYIDNYKCFTNFEYRPGPLQLLMGRNGTGKTVVFDVLDVLSKFVLAGTSCASTFQLESLTAWDRRKEQTFELGMNGRGGSFVYRLIVEQNRAARKSRIAYEDLSFDGKVLYQFQDGKAHLFRDDGSAGPVFPFDSSRSAIATIPETKDNTLLSWFRWRLNRLFSPDPLRMTSRSDEEQPHPDRGLRDLASWIRHLHLESPEASQRLAESLREDVLNGFTGYRFLDQGEGSRALKFEFVAPTLDIGEFTKTFSLGLDELSTGQRNLVALYTMLHGAIGPDMTLCIDEPDNYVALREIQPWLIELTDKAKDTGGQCLLISHHPEIIDYLAADSGSRFFRENGGPVRVQPFKWTEDDVLRPGEVVARGWEDR